MGKRENHHMILCQDGPAALLLQDMGDPLYLLERKPSTEKVAK